MIELDGQGVPLPKDFGFLGAWINEDDLFLYRPTIVGSELVHNIAVLVPYDDGTSATGISASALSVRFELSIATLFENNAAGKLHLITKNEVPSLRDGITQVLEYEFEINEKRAVLTTDLEREK